MRVYLVGASGVGKTTLAEHIHERHSLPLLPSAARTVAAEMGIRDFLAIFRDTSLADRYQKAVFKRQRDNEWNAKGRFVSDRAFDHIAYLADLSRIAWQIVRDPSWPEYLQGLKQPDATIFWIRPVGESGSFGTAKDGSRDPFLEPGFVHRQDGVIQFVLESNEIPYFPIASVRLRDRIRLVDNVLALKKGH